MHGARNPACAHPLPGLAIGDAVAVPLGDLGLDLLGGELRNCSRKSSCSSVKTSRRIMGEAPRKRPKSSGSISTPGISLHSPRWTRRVGKLIDPSLRSAISSPSQGGCVHARSASVVVLRAGGDRGFARGRGDRPGQAGDGDPVPGDDRQGDGNLHRCADEGAEEVLGHRRRREADRAVSRRQGAEPHRQDQSEARQPHQQGLVVAPTRFAAPTPPPTSRSA